MWLNNETETSITMIRNLKWKNEKLSSLIKDEEQL